jgi:hypothetical protein
MVLLFTMFLGSASARGDTVTFLDAIDGGGPFVTTTTAPGRTIITPPVVVNDPTHNFFVTVDLLPPSPLAQFVSDSCPLGQGDPIPCSHVNVGEYPINPNPLFDLESDLFSGLFFQPAGAYRGNLAIMNIPPGISCNSESGCNVRENGLVYTLDTITWSDGTVDTIKFQAIQAIPEPSSLVLVGTCLLGLAGIFKRKL